MRVLISSPELIDCTLFEAILTLGKKAFENIVGIGEIADNQHFLPFPQCFLSDERQIS